MRGETCSREDAVVRAVRSGAWTESLEAHARDCAICREAREAARWMRALAREGEEPRDLPDARTLWLRAQLQSRQAAAGRAQRLALWIEIGCALAIGAGLGVWAWSEAGGSLIDRATWALFEGWPALWANLSSYNYSFHPPSNTLDAPVLFSGAIAALPIAVLTILVLALAYPLVARE